jgi:hypothetical protein
MAQKVRCSVYEVTVQKFVLHHFFPYCYKGYQTSPIDFHLKSKKGSNQPTVVYTEDSLSTYANSTLTE